MKKNKQEAESEAIRLQTELNKIYTHRVTGRRVQIKMIDAQIAVDSKDNYDVQVSTLDLDAKAPHPMHITEKSEYFFSNYKAN